VPIAGIGDRSIAPFEPLISPEGKKVGRVQRLTSVLADRRLVIFAACAALFQFANAAMLPLASSLVTKRATDQATLLIAACIVLPQLVVALVSPSVGRFAERLGRRPMLLLGFSILPVRGLLLAVIADPMFLVLVQVLDGIAAACFGVLMPLITSDVAGRSGHFNLSLGVMGFAIGIGATLSTTVAGWIADRFGDPVAFLSLGGVALSAMLLVWAAMVETRPPRE
jgi:MFS family permease